MRILEKHVVASVLNLVMILPGCFFWRANTGAVKADQRFIRFNTPGTPDVLGCYFGRFVGIECKGTGGKQSHAQMQWQCALEAVGGLYILAHSAEDVVMALHQERIVHSMVTHAKT